MTPNLSAPKTSGQWVIFVLLLSTFFTGLFLYDERGPLASVGTGVFGAVLLGVAIYTLVFTWRRIRVSRG